MASDDDFVAAGQVHRGEGYLLRAKGRRDASAARAPLGTFGRPRMLPLAYLILSVGPARRRQSCLSKVRDSIATWSLAADVVPHIAASARRRTILHESPPITTTSIMDTHPAAGEIAGLLDGATAGFL